MSHAESISSPESDWSTRIGLGDERAFRELFDTYYEALCRYATTLTGDPDASADLVQAVFVWIWEHRAEWKVRGSMRGYLYRAVHSRVVSGWRALRVRETHAASVQADEAGALGGGGEVAVARHVWPDQAAQYAELQGAYWRAVATLPPRGRQAIELHQQHDLSCREIAQVMGISPRTVEAHIGRALVTLRRALAVYLSVALIITSR